MINIELIDDQETDIVIAVTFACEYNCSISKICAAIIKLKDQFHSSISPPGVLHVHEASIGQWQQYLN